MGRLVKWINYEAMKFGLLVNTSNKIRALYQISNFSTLTVCSPSTVLESPFLSLSPLCPCVPVGYFSHVSENI